MRIDQLLVKLELSSSRSRAQSLIAAGRVRYDIGRGWELASKASLDVPETTPLTVIPDPADRYVSRGGLKLAGALTRVGLSVTGANCLDVGQSTGGFTDCLLQAGAARVVGVEVGHGQLHPRLRDHPKVVCLEGVNARTGLAANLGTHVPATGFKLIVTDASFISLALLLPNYPTLLSPDGHVLALVKPQFEVGPAHLSKGGIVRDANLYPAVAAKIRAVCAEVGLTVLDWFESPITGGDGNREFFVYATASENA